MSESIFRIYRFYTSKMAKCRMNNFVFHNFIGNMFVLCLLKISQLISIFRKMLLENSHTSHSFLFSSSSIPFPPCLSLIHPLSLYMYAHLHISTRGEHHFPSPSLNITRLAIYLQTKICWTFSVALMKHEKRTIPSEIKQIDMNKIFE